MRVRSSSPRLPTLTLSVTRTLNLSLKPEPKPAPNPKRKPGPHQMVSCAGLIFDVLQRIVSVDAEDDQEARPPRGTYLYPTLTLTGAGTFTLIEEETEEPDPNPDRGA